jgi:alkylation response protein AidB-like acyl-CoA dehydrogenase
MRFGLTDEQQLLADVTRDVAASLFKERRLIDIALGREAPSTDSWWASLHELGLVGLLVAEEHGGSGGSLVDACVVAEALGEALAPVPYVGSAIAVPAVLSACGGDRSTLEAVASGRRCSLLVGSDLAWPHAAPTIAWDWSEGALGITVAGGVVGERPLPGTTAFARSLDPLHPIAVVPAGEPASSTGTPGIATPGIAWSRAAMRVGGAAFALGLAARALAEAVDYAKQRQQYGRTIGSFQAIAHLLADMLVDVETSRSIVYGAAWSVDRAPLRAAERSAAAALSWGGEAAVRVCETAIQVLGGIGVTVEHPAHLRLRGAHALASSFGGASGAHEDLVELHLAQAVEA